MNNFIRDNEFQEKAKAYARIKNRLFFCDFFSMVIYFIIILLSGFSLAIENFLRDQVGSNPYLLLALYLFFIGIVFSCFTFWLEYYDGFYLERKFGLSAQNFRSWLKDKFKKDSISFTLTILMLELIYVFLRKSPHFWWFWACVLWIFVTILLSYMLPTVIIPVFFKQEPVEDEQLRQKLDILSEKTNSGLKDFKKINLSKQTKKANAALVGWGASKRVVFSDTLLKDYTIDEIVSVAAHEIGHFRLNHLWKLLFFGSFVSLGGFYLTSIVLNSTFKFFGFEYAHSIAAFPLLALILAGYAFAVKPIQNYFSRRLEKQADCYALQYIEDPLHFKEALLKLERQNLADPAPSKFIEIFLYDHPPISKRIKTIEEFKR